MSLGASPDYKDRRGLTPLYHTVLTGGDTSCCETLLYHRAKLGMRDENGWDETHQVQSVVCACLCMYARVCTWVCECALACLWLWLCSVLCIRTVFYCLSVSLTPSFITAQLHPSHLHPSLFLILPCFPLFIELALITSEKFFNNITALWESCVFFKMHILCCFVLATINIVRT